MLKKASLMHFELLRNSSYALLGILFIFLTGCSSNDDELEFVTADELKTSFKTTDIYTSELILTSPALNGVHKVQICYGTMPHPKITDNITTATLSDGVLHLHLKGLKSGTDYYIRPYVMNGSKVKYLEDDEIVVQTVGTDTGGNSNNDFYASVGTGLAQIVNYKYEVLLPCGYIINKAGTYKVSATPDDNFSITTDGKNYQKSIYVEGRSGSFMFLRENGTYTGPGIAVFPTDTDIQFENLDTGVRYHIIVPKRWEYN